MCIRDSINTGQFVNRGFLNGPVCPIYGFGMVIVLVALTPLALSLIHISAVLGPSLAFALLHVLGRELSFAGILQLLAAGTAVGVLFSLVAYESGTVWCLSLIHI